MNFYITTAISYPNGKPHIGHAYELILADAIAREWRQRGYEVDFQTGTDEYGLKMLQTARREGMTAQELVDRNHKVFVDLADTLDISYTRFVRTTDPEHHKVAQGLWDDLVANGYIYLGKYSGYYSVRDERYYNEDELSDDGNGGKIAIDTGRPVEWIEEPSYFFSLANFQESLKLFNMSMVAPESTKKEMLALLEQPLEDVSISRTTFDWGVPVPNDPEHVMYVWVDALSNYLRGSVPADLHVIGKDIARFHTILWPALLSGANKPIPKKVFAHGFILNDGKKIGKSDGNSIDPFEIVEKYGLDQFRYFLLREIVAGNDGNFTEAAIKNRINSDLANDYGNLLQRTLTQVHRHFDGRTPPRTEYAISDQFVIEWSSELSKEVSSLVAEFQIHAALERVWHMIAQLNSYISDEAPWTVIKTDKARAANILHTVMMALRDVSICLLWAIPDSANRALDMLGIPLDCRLYEHINADLLDVELPEPQILFPKVV